MPPLSKPADFFKCWSK